MPEWAFRITRYSQSLLSALDELKEWPERITAVQRNWIGKSEGVEVDFALEARPGHSRLHHPHRHHLRLHLRGAGARSPPRGDDHAARPARLGRGLRGEDGGPAKVERTEEGAEKEGVFTGAFAVNPFTGEKVPVWIANFVLSDYGTGAVMSVPAHDSRDFDFAQKYGLLAQDGDPAGERRRCRLKARSPTTGCWWRRASTRE